MLNIIKLCIGMSAIVAVTIPAIMIIVWPEPERLPRKPVMREFKEIHTRIVQPAVCCGCGFSRMSCLCKKAKQQKKIITAGFEL